MQQGNNAVGFRKLRIWQEAHIFVKMVYAVTKTFPREEIMGITSQLRRAAVSIAANIVEGYSYHSNKKFLQYLNISRGSLTESEYYLQLALDLNYINQEKYQELETQRGKVGAYLTNLIKAIKQPSNKVVKHESVGSL